MNYAILENEEFARRNLRNIIQNIRNDAVCVFMAESVAEAVSYFSKDPELDLIFMDIELDDGNCFEIFKQCDLRFPVIFTTAYDEYAVRAFKVNSIDYLLKPYGDDDVRAAIKKYEQRVMPVQPDYPAVGHEISRSRARSRILISSGDTYTYMRTEEIAWVEAGDKYISVILAGGRSVLTDFASLGDVLDVLDPEEFYQVSRSVIASIGSISKISKYFKGRLIVQLKAGQTERNETVSAARRDEFLAWLGHSGH